MVIKTLITTSASAATPFDAIIQSSPLSVCHTVIWLHGLGADGRDFIDIVPELCLPEALAVRFIFPHAPVRPVSINGGLAMRAWFDIHGLNQDAEIDAVGVIESTARLHAMIDQEITRGVPAHRIVLAGFSQGGALALYAGLNYPQRLGGILGLSTYLPMAALQHIPQPKQVPPIFLTHGEYDTVVSMALGEASRDYLAAHHYPVQWQTYPMEHTLCVEEIHDIAAWLNRIFTAL